MFRAGGLVFSDKTPAPARKLISSLIVPVGVERAGYTNSEGVRNQDYFEGMEIGVCLSICVLSLYYIVLYLIL